MGPSRKSDSSGDGADVDFLGELDRFVRAVAIANGSCRARQAAISVITGVRDVFRLCCVGTFSTPDVITLNTMSTTRE